jgi:hypothetical protein
LGRRIFSHATSLGDKLLALRISGLSDGHGASTGAYPFGALGKALSDKKTGLASRWYALIAKIKQAVNEGSSKMRKQ